MRAITNPNHFSATIVKGIKLFLMMALFTVVFQKISYTQICSGMTTAGTVSNTGDIITYKANINFTTEEQIINWTIDPNTSGAFFTANGKKTLQQTAINGENSIKLNVGKKAGAFTVTLTFDEVSPADVGSCSASRTVNKAPVH